MDMSKLPRLSNTPVPPPAAPEPKPAQNAGYGPARAPLSGIAEAWLSFAIAAFLLFTNTRLEHYLVYRDNVNDLTDLNTGVVTPYLQTAGFKVDLGITVFAVALVIDGLVLLLPRRAWSLMTLIGLTLATAVLNLWVIASCWNPYGLQYLPALAVALSGYMAIVQWAALSEVRISRA